MSLEGFEKTCELLVCRVGEHVVEGDRPRTFDRVADQLQLPARSHGVDTGIEAAAEPGMVRGGLAAVMEQVERVGDAAKLIQIANAVARDRTRTGLLGAVGGEAPHAGVECGHDPPARSFVEPPLPQPVQALFEAPAPLLGALESPSVLYFVAPLFGICMGGFGVVHTLYVQDTFGLTHFGAIMGLLNATMVVSFGLGPVIAGLSFDWTGSYGAGFAVAGALFATAAATLVLSRPPGR